MSLRSTKALGQERFTLSGQRQAPRAVARPTGHRLASRDHARCKACDGDEACAGWQNALDGWAMADHPQQQHVEQQPVQQRKQQQPDPAAALRRVLEVVRSGQLDPLLEFCPDEVIDKLLALRKETGSTEQVHFEDIVRASCDGESTPFLDTYSLRNLVMAAPRSVQLLSAMHVSPEKYLQRCAIVAPSGEECVLTFSAALQEVQECQYRGPPLLFKKWMLQGVTGECNSDELPSHPSPSFPPEAVVEAQLAALREGRVASVFAHASPENKASTGPVEKFAAMLNHNPLYSPLMGHVTAETVQRLQPSETTYMEVIRITPAAQQQQQPGQSGNAAVRSRGVAAAAHGSAGGKCGGSSNSKQQQQQLIFMWILSRQCENSAWSNCWMTDAVRPVSSIPAEFTR